MSAKLCPRPSELVARLTEQPKNLGDRTFRYLADLEEGVTTFDSQQRIADIVAGLTLQDVVAYLEQTTMRLGDARLLIFSTGRFDEAPEHGRPLATGAAEG